MSSSLSLKKFLLFLGDLVLLYCSLLFTVFLGFGGEFSFQNFLLHLLPFSILYFFWLIIFYIFGLYELHLIKTKVSFYSRVIGALSLNLVIGMLFFYTIPFFGITPKTNLIINVLVFLILFILWRNLFYSIFSVYFLNRVAIVGQGEDVESFERDITERPFLGYKLVNINLTRDLLSQIQDENVDTVIFTEEFESDPEMLKALYFCLPARVNFLDFASAYEIITEKIPVSMVSKSWFLENLKEGNKTVYDKLKRIFDVILAVFILLITLPLWLFIAVLIKLEDRGKVFYKQERIGKDRKNFSLIKFRSMIENAEQNGPQWAEKKDSRVTKVGRFFKKNTFR